MAWIECQLDDDWKDDLVDLQGSITLIGTHGEQLTEPCTNIDTFFAGLASIALCFRNSEAMYTEVDLVIEPAQLCATVHPNGEIEVNYGEQCVRFLSLHEFDKNLQRAVNQFLELLPNTLCFDAPPLQALREYTRELKD